MAAILKQGDVVGVAGAAARGEAGAAGGSPPAQTPTLYKSTCFGNPTKAAVKRMCADFRQLGMACLGEGEKDIHMEVLMPDPNAVHIWRVILHRSGFEAAPALVSAMRDENIQGVELELQFPNDFPYSPPFVRVVSPILEGGFVLTHGGICLQSLSFSGWAPAMRIELLLQEIRSQMIGNNVRLAPASGRPSRSYSESGARADFEYAMKVHSW